MVCIDETPTSCELDNDSWCCPKELICNYNVQNWWSANAWYGALNMQMLELSDCRLEVNGGCEELNNVGKYPVWLKNVPNSSNAFLVSTASGTISQHARSSDQHHLGFVYALCK